MAVLVFDDLWQTVRDLPREQGEALLFACCAYGIDGEEPDLDGVLGMLFRAYRYRIERSAEASAKGRAMAEARWGTRGESKHDAAASSARDAVAPVPRQGKSRGGKGSVAGAFSAPSPEEVRAYSEERGLGIDPERFVDYYAAQGWRLSNGRPMRDWRAAARNWARRDGRRAAGAARDEFTAYSAQLRVVGEGEAI